MGVVGAFAIESFCEFYKATTSCSSLDFAPEFFFMEIWQLAVELENEPPQNPEPGLETDQFHQPPLSFRDSTGSQKATLLPTGSW